MGSISQTLSLSPSPSRVKKVKIKTRDMSDTLFLLDMLRLANQEKVRAKKDEKIHDMAMEQKKRMEEAKKSGIPNYSGSTGGFVGIDQLTKSSSNARHNVAIKKSKIEDEMDETPANTKLQDGEMFILGLLKEQRQEEVYRERFNQISEESLGCVSDEKCLKMFEN